MLPAVVPVWTPRESFWQCSLVLVQFLPPGAIYPSSKLLMPQALFLSTFLVTEARLYSLSLSCVRVLQSDRHPAAACIAITSPVYAPSQVVLSCQVPSHLPHAPLCSIARNTDESLLCAQCLSLVLSAETRQIMTDSPFGNLRGSAVTLSWSQLSLGRLVETHACSAVHLCRLFVETRGTLLATRAALQMRRHGRWSA